MGKNKTIKEKKFDRNVEISAPILDPEIIKAIHSPPKGGHRVDIRHGGFKALLSDLNSQDSTDELAPLNDNHVPSYIGISCAVSGYSSYSAYNKTDDASTENGNHDSARWLSGTIPNKSRATSPIIRTTHQVNHIVIDKSNIHSADEERKKLTEKLTASATEQRRSPSPVVPPTEDDRHHGAYVGARYCPLPPPSKVVNKHIPLLGIDDDQNPDDVLSEDENKVEKKIASLYGDNFVEDWRESMTHKTKKELTDQQQQREKQQVLKCPKDLVTLKPTSHVAKEVPQEEVQVNMAAPGAKVLAGVEKQFLNKLLTDENPPMPKQPTPSPKPLASPVAQKVTREESRTIPSPEPTPTELNQSETTPASVRSSVESPIAQTESLTHIEFKSYNSLIDDSSHEPIAETVEVIREETQTEEASPTGSPRMSPSQEAAPQEEASPTQPQVSPSNSPDSARSESSVVEADLAKLSSDSHVGLDEQNIEYEIRAQSPLDNQSSPVKMLEERDVSLEPQSDEADSRLVSFSPDVLDASPKNPDETSQTALDQQNNNMNIIQHEVQQIGDHIIEHETMDSILDLGEVEAHPVRESAKEAVEVGELIESSVSTFEAVDNSGRDGRYYLNLLEAEKRFINEQVTMAESVLAEQESELNEDTVGRIRSAIGKANLLVNKKCNQFKELCEANMADNNEEQQQQFATLNDDLAGFWDIVTIQVSDVRKSFEALWQARANDWKFNDNKQKHHNKDEEDSHERGTGKSLGGKPKLSTQKDQERRERLQEHINQLRQSQAAAKSSAEHLPSSLEGQATKLNVKKESDPEAEKPEGTEIASEDLMG